VRRDRRGRLRDAEGRLRSDRRHRRLDEQFLDEFPAVQWRILDASGDRAAIRTACKGAGLRAAIVATKSEGAKALTAWHGYAVLGMSRKTVRLWDPLRARHRKSSSATC
jgi:hypothetical protein